MLYYEPQANIASVHNPQIVINCFVVHEYYLKLLTKLSASPIEGYLRFIGRSCPLNNYGANFSLVQGWSDL